MYTHDVYYGSYYQKMIRTQIYLPKIVHEHLKQIAKERDKSMAEIIREYIEKGIKLNTSPTKESNFKQLTKLNIKGGPVDLSENMDDYLYGDK